MEMVYHDSQRMIAWAAERIGIERFRDDARAIGIAKNGELRAVVVYDTFSACDCHMHVASDGSRRWLSREVLAHLFAYPFIQCGLRRVTGMVPASNREALKFDLHLGFKFEGAHPESLPDDGMVSLGMLRRNCPYIPLEYRHA